MEKDKKSGVNKARVIQVIETKAIKGIGTKEDPVRFVTQYWDFQGNILAERDYDDESFFGKDFR